jgi:hypothetical protein
MKRLCQLLGAAFVAALLLGCGDSKPSPGEGKQDPGKPQGGKGSSGGTPPPMPAPPPLPGMKK